VEVHPEKDDGGEDGEHANDNAGGALGSVGGGEGLLNEDEFSVCAFGFGLLVLGAHAGFLSEVRDLRREVIP